MNQKLAYMHANPCAGNGNSPIPIDYEHSSARFYISSKHAAYKVTNVDEVLKIILNNSAETTAKHQARDESRREERRRITCKALIAQ